jgi:hypothetical protein
MLRRRFMFWIGFGLFNLSQKLRADGLDDLAAAAMKSADPAPAAKLIPKPVHWTAGSNKTWRWYERENLVNGQWKVTGITTPIHKRTGERFTGREGYLDDSLLPVEMRAGTPPRGDDQVTPASAVTLESAVDDSNRHLPDAMRRANHGRPPSKWLRSLYASELRIWLKTIDVPEAGVEGMTFWEHLTRDHSFESDKIAGLTIDEQAKLHAAAHYGY